MKSDFREIGHCGGTVTFKFEKAVDGSLKVGFRWQSSRPNPASLAALYVLSNGIPVAPIRMGGIGDPWSPPPCEGCITVLIGSDSQGEFGHQCPTCDGYWRSAPTPNVCPYCWTPVEMQNCLSPAQRGYIAEYLRVFTGAHQDAFENLPAGQSKDYKIDMDAVADAVSSDLKPDFYFAEESQQNQFRCQRCQSMNDVIGRYAYCCVCGERNDAVEAKSKIDNIRATISEGGELSTAVKSSISLFDSFVDQMVGELLAFVPMTRKRRSRLERRSFHDFSEVSEVLKEVFDIEIASGIKRTDIDLVERFFHRRHLHEHRGSIVDQKYIDDSGDQTVRLKQELREELGEVHRLLSLLNQIFSNLHQYFHEILPPLERRTIKG